MGEYPLKLQQRYLIHTRLRYAKGWEPLTLTRYSDLSQYTDPSECIVFWSDMISRTGNSLDNWTTNHIIEPHKSPQTRLVFLLHPILRLHLIFTYPNECFLLWYRAENSQHNHRTTPSNPKRPQTSPVFLSHEYWDITQFLDLSKPTVFWYAIGQETHYTISSKPSKLNLTNTTTVVALSNDTQYSDYLRLL